MAVSLSFFLSVRSWVRLLYSQLPRRSATSGGTNLSLIQLNKTRQVWIHPNLVLLIINSLNYCTWENTSLYTIMSKCLLRSIPTQARQHLTLVKPIHIRLVGVALDVFLPIWQKRRQQPFFPLSCQVESILKNSAVHQFNQHNCFQHLQQEMFLKHQITILEYFLKDRMAEKINTKNMNVEIC